MSIELTDEQFCILYPHIKDKVWAELFGVSLDVIYRKKKKLISDGKLTQLKRRGRPFNAFEIKEIPKDIDSFYDLIRIIVKDELAKAS